MLTTKLFKRSSVDDEASEDDGSKPSTTIYLDTPCTPHAAPSRAAQHPLASCESPHNYLHADLFSISYAALNASDSYLAPSSPPPPHFVLPARYYKSTIPAAITATQQAVVHLLPNVLRFEGSNGIWSGRRHACIFDCFRERL